jgi:hypothetical protein
MSVVLKGAVLKGAVPKGVAQPSASSPIAPPIVRRYHKTMRQPAMEHSRCLFRSCREAVATTTEEIRQ